MGWMSVEGRMARPLRFQYPGAIYHVMARGDGGKKIFETDDDRLVFLKRLEEVCGSCGWRVHAWVLMNNHFHLLLETPQPNLVAGMKWLLGVFSQGWNRARGRQGHVFQGRYKAVPVNGSVTDRYYFRIVADYIHLNPARAKLAGGKSGRLTDYRWSSLPCFAKGKEPAWLVTDRVLQSFELSESGRGRRAYVDWLEARAANDGGKIDRRAQEALRRGWYLGEDSFRDCLLDLVDKAKGVKARKSKKSESVARDHGLRDTESIIETCGPVLELPKSAADLAKLRKGDERKALLAAILRTRTSVGFDWIAKRLAMGHPGSVSRLVSKVNQDPKLQKRTHELEKMLQ
jgi:putative transposase